MPIKPAIWKVARMPDPLREISLAIELCLKDTIVGQPAILSDDWMLIEGQP